MSARMPEQALPVGVSDVETFVSQLNKAFLTLDYKDYPVTNEASCRAFASVFLAGAGLPTQTETHNALGRSDLEFSIGDTLWVLEFKYARDKSRKEKPEARKEQGLAQIDKRMYGRQGAEKWLKRVSLVFSENRRQIVQFEEREPIEL